MRVSHSNFQFAAFRRLGASLLLLLLVLLSLSFE